MPRHIHGRLQRHTGFREKHRSQRVGGEVVDVQPRRARSECVRSRAPRATSSASHEPAAQQAPKDPPAALDPLLVLHSGSTDSSFDGQRSRGASPVLQQTCGGTSDHRPNRQVATYGTRKRWLGSSRPSETPRPWAPCTPARRQESTARECRCLKLRFGRKHQRGDPRIGQQVTPGPSTSDPEEADAAGAKPAFGAAGFGFSMGARAQWNRPAVTKKGPAQFRDARFPASVITIAGCCPTVERRPTGALRARWRVRRPACSPWRYSLSCAPTCPWRPSGARRGGRPR